MAIKKKTLATIQKEIETNHAQLEAVQQRIHDEEVRRDEYVRDIAYEAVFGGCKDTGELLQLAQSIEDKNVEVQIIPIIQGDSGGEFYDEG